MKFNFQRVRTPAYITSVVLVVIGLLFALGSMAAAAWIFVILGVALNVMAVSVIEITERGPREVDPASRVVVEPEVDTEQQVAVAPAAETHAAASGPARSARDEKPGKTAGSTSLRGNVSRTFGGAREAQPHRPQPQHK